MNSVYIEMKLSDFVVKCPQLCCNPSIMPVVAKLMRDNKDDLYLVRIKNGRIEFGYGEDAWTIH